MVVQKTELGFCLSLVSGCMQVSSSDNKPDPGRLLFCPDSFVPCPVSEHCMQWFVETWFCPCHSIPVSGCFCISQAESCAV